MVQIWWWQGVRGQRCRYRTFGWWWWLAYCVHCPVPGKTTVVIFHSGPFCFDSLYINPLKPTKTSLTIWRTCRVYRSSWDHDLNSGYDSMPTRYDAFHPDMIFSMQLISPYHAGIICSQQYLLASMHIDCTVYINDVHQRLYVSHMFAPSLYIYIFWNIKLRRKKIYSKKL